MVISKTDVRVKIFESWKLFIFSKTNVCENLFVLSKTLDFEKPFEFAMIAVEEKPRSHERL